MIYSLVIVSALVVYANAVAKEGWVFRNGFHNAGRVDAKKGDRVAPHKKHDVQIVIKLRNMDVMKDVLMRVSDPTHEDYGKHWTAEQIAEMTANYDGSYKVRKYLEAHGARLTARYGNDDILHFQAPVSVWEHVFATEFYEFSHADFKGENVVRATEYSLPMELDAEIDTVFKVAELPPRTNGKPTMIAEVGSIATVGATTDTPVTSSNPMAMVQPGSTTSAPWGDGTTTGTPVTRGNPIVQPAPTTGAPAASSSGPQGLLVSGQVTPQFLYNWYNIQSTATANVRQSIFASLGQYASNTDMTNFQSTMGYAVKPLAGNLGVAGHINHAACTANSDNCAETNLDIEYISTIGANVPTYHMYYNDADYWSMFANLTSVATKNPPKVISISYGGYGFSPLQASSFNNYAILAGTLGISVLVSSGDDGALNFGVRNGDGCHYEPSFPAYSPYVTAVGATQGPEKGGAEVACSSMTAGVITTGGGFSLYDARPTWQTAQVNTYFTTVAGQGKSPVAGYASPNRGYPDISLLGANYRTLIGGNYHSLFGTSASSPALAGMISLINSALVASGKTTMGFLNPFLYAYSGSFIRDITSGSNFCTVGGKCCPQGFYAATGWDPVTGLGVPNFEQMKAAAIASKSATTPTATPTTVAPVAAPTATPTAPPNQTPPGTFPIGIQYNAAPLPGYTRCYFVPYGTWTHTSDIQNCCNSYSKLLVAGLESASSSTFLLGAYGSSASICTKTGLNQVTANNGLYWYFNTGYSFGFARTAKIAQHPADNLPGADRLSWHIDITDGGWRIGNLTWLNWDTIRYKVIYGYDTRPTATPTSSPVATPTACLPGKFCTGVAAIAGRYATAQACVTACGAGKWASYAGAATGWCGCSSSCATQVINNYYETFCPYSSSPTIRPTAIPTINPTAALTASPTSLNKCYPGTYCSYQMIVYPSPVASPAQCAVVCAAQKFFSYVPLTKWCACAPAGGCSSRVPNQYSDSYCL